MSSNAKAKERMIFSKYPFREASGRSHAAAVAVGTALLFGSSAEAHTGTGLAGGFASGFKHPFTGSDHLLAMVSVGLWGAFLGRPLIYTLPVIFPAVMVGGAVLGMLGVPLPPVEIGIALSVLVLGACIALSLKVAVWAASLIVAAFAVFHGYAHGRELPSAADPIGYIVGFVLATGLLHVLGIGIGFLNDRPGGVVATRSLGGVIGCMGVWFLCKAIGL
jgi:urease accessory protein